MEHAITHDQSQPSLYCQSRDYQHLTTCKYGQVSTSTNNSETEINKNTPRDTVQKNQFAGTYTQTGPKYSAAKLQETERMLKPVK